jgi:hypothetical protein
LHHNDGHLPELGGTKEVGMRLLEFCEFLEEVIASEAAGATSQDFPPLVFDSIGVDQ